MAKYPQITITTTIKNFSDLIRVALFFNQGYSRNEWSNNQYAIVKLGQDMQAKVVEDFRNKVKEAMDKLKDSKHSNYVPILQLYYSSLYNYLYDTNYSIKEANQEPIFKDYFGDVYSYIQSIDIDDSDSKFELAFIKSFIQYIININKLSSMSNEEIAQHSREFVDSRNIFKYDLEDLVALSPSQRKCLDFLCNGLGFEPVDWSRLG